MGATGRRQGGKDRRRVGGLGMRACRVGWRICIVGHASARRGGRTAGAHWRTKAPCGSPTLARCDKRLAARAPVLAYQGECRGVGWRLGGRDGRMFVTVRRTCAPARRIGWRTRAPRWTQQHARRAGSSPSVRLQCAKLHEEVRQPATGKWLWRSRAGRLPLIQATPHLLPSSSPCSPSALRRQNPTRERVFRNAQVVRSMNENGTGR